MSDSADGLPEESVRSADRLEVNPTSVTLTEIGESAQLAATVFDTNGEVIAGVTVIWSSNDPSVATVSDSGLVRAAGEGSAEITADGRQPVGPCRHLDRNNRPGGVDRALQRDWRPILENNTNWLSDEPVGGWYGVTTDEDGRVTDLRLEQNNLKGKIPTEIGRLEKLTALYLNENRLSGGIPPEIGNLKSLIHLWLAFNQLSGMIPPEIGQLQGLSSLILNYNENLSGQLPIAIT